jgi:hypothetical protein
VNPTNAALFTGVIVVGGNWAQGKGLQLQHLAAAVFYGIMLTGLSAINEQLASQFATIVLISAGFIYIVPIAKGLGVVKK